MIKIIKIHIICLFIANISASLLLADPVLDIVDSKNQAEVIIKKPRKESALSKIEEFMKEDPSSNDLVDRSSPDYSPVPLYFEIDPVSKGKFELLADSLRNNRTLDYPEYYTGFIKEDKGIAIDDKQWTENFINIVSNIAGLRILFDYSGEIKPDENKARSFYVNLEFEEEELLAERLAVFKGQFRNHNVGHLSYSLIAKHSKPKVSKEVGGIRIPVTEDRQNRIFLQGQDQTSIALMLPKVKKKGPRGVLLCPRDYDFWKVKGGSRTMKNTNYNLAGVDFQARSLVQGRVLTGLGPGFASASIQTTSNIKPSKVRYDESYSVHPYVAVEYLPSKSLQPPEAKEREEVTGGIKVQLVLHNSLDQKLIITGIVRATVRKVDLKSSFPLKHEGNQFRVKAGDCYGVIKEVDLSYRLVKDKTPNAPELSTKNK